MSDILDRIDQTLGCQQCGGDLGDSPSDDFCSEGCQQTWHAARADAQPEYATGGAIATLPEGYRPADPAYNPFRCYPQRMMLGDHDPNGNWWFIPPEAARHPVPIPISPEQWDAAVDRSADELPCWCVEFRADPDHPIDPAATIRCDDCGSRLR